MTIRNVTRLLSGVVIAAACVAACTNEVPGTPRAAPGLTSSPTGSSPTGSSPTTATTSPRATPSTPNSTTVPTRTSGPASAPAGADTTCEEYIDLDEDAQRAVINAISEENELVAVSPELWVTVVSALCTFAEPTTPVREVLEGQGIR